MEKSDRRLVVLSVIGAVLGACIIIGLRIAVEVIITDNNLRKEEITLTRSMLKELSDVKNMVGEMQSKLSQPPARGQMPEPPKPGSKKVEGVSAGTNPLIGEAGAPVLLVQFGDFQCPFSKKFIQETFDQIKKEYISSGKVKFAYRDYPLPFHPQAQPAAVAARCASRQNKYWEMFDKFSGNEELSAQSITAAAKAIGLKMSDFQSCQADPAVKEAVKNDSDEGAKYGVSGTPAFFINGRMIEGAYPYDAFKTVIEEELARK